MTHYDNSNRYCPCCVSSVVFPVAPLISLGISKDDLTLNVGMLVSKLPLREKGGV